MCNYISEPSCKLQKQIQRFKISCLVNFLNDRSPITKAFPEYTGEMNYDAAGGFICKQFESKNKSDLKGKVEVTIANSSKAKITVI